MAAQREFTSHLPTVVSKPPRSRQPNTPSGLFAEQPSQDRQIKTRLRRQVKLLYKMSGSIRLGYLREEQPVELSIVIALHHDIGGSTKFLDISAKSGWPACKSLHQSTIKVPKQWLLFGSKLPGKLVRLQVRLLLPAP